MRIVDGKENVIVFDNNLQTLKDVFSFMYTNASKDVKTELKTFLRPDDACIQGPSDLEIMCPACDSIFSGYLCADDQDRLNDFSTMEKELRAKVKDLEGVCKERHEVIAKNRQLIIDGEDKINELEIEAARDRKIIDKLL